MDCYSSRRKQLATAVAAVLAMASAAPVRADPSCQPIQAPVLEIGAVDCAQVLPQLRASGQFPDVFAGSEKILGLCYAPTAPVPATIGNTAVTITSTLSAWTTDFVPGLFMGPDNLGTVATQVTVGGLHGNSTADYFTRDTIDLSQIFSKGTADEEDVIVGGDAYLQGASGTYRVSSTPEDMQASKVLLTNLNGLICTH